MHVRQVGFNHQSFARNAKKVMVDIDLQELNKPNLDIDLKIQMDLSSFLGKFIDLLDSQDHSYNSNNKHKSFLNWCKRNVQDLQVMQPHHYKPTNGTVNPYLFVERLFERLDKNATVITGDGTAAVVTFKAAYLREGQRLYTNKGCANMGYDIPALIGSLHAKKENKILITGDGSLMMNIQDLASLKPFKKQDIKIFVLNNSGYHSIRQTQKNYFDNFEVGCGESTNLFFPDLRKIADCFDLDYFLVNDSKTLNKSVESTTKQIKLIEVVVDKNQNFEPRVGSKKLADGSMVSSPLEEMSPLLPKEEFLKRMLIKPSKDTNYE
jgi:acetolactate synthase-1/2/3 large subunit